MFLLSPIVLCLKLYNATPLAVSSVHSYNPCTVSPCFFLFRSAGCVTQLILILSLSVSTVPFPLYSLICCLISPLNDVYLTAISLGLVDLLVISSSTRRRVIVFVVITYKSTSFHWSVENFSLYLAIDTQLHMV